MNSLMLSQLCDPVTTARLHTAHLMVEDIIRKSNERNGENLDRVLRQSNRSS